MSNAIEVLGVGEEVTKGGEGARNIPVPAQDYPQRIDLIAYHMGRTGRNAETDSRGPYASILLSMNGIRLGNPEDNNFENYYLELRRTIILERGTSASFKAEFTNSGGATTTLKGLIATVKHIKLSKAAT